MNAKYFLLVIMFPLMQIHAQEAWKFSVELSKETYLLGELIDIGIGIKNNTASALKPSYSRPVSVKILDGSNSFLPYTGPDGPDFFSPQSYYVLDPGEETYRMFSLNRLYGKMYPRFSGFYYLSPGSYELQAVFKMEDMEAETLKVNFSVTEPKGDELTVYNQFFNSLIEPHIEKNNAGNYVNFLDALQKKYPSSVYAPIILSEMESMYNVILLDSNKSKGLMEYIAENYTWSSETIGSIECLLKGMKSESEKMDYLKRLQEKSKNSLMYKVIERFQKGKYFRL